MPHKQNKQEDKQRPKCFVIMPIADMPDYEKGHFRRVYDHLIKPACNEVGFEPVRADDVVHTNNIVIDILKNILDCEMAICDLSGRNPNALYELGIRQAFNKPVTLIKDDKTARIFDISSFRDCEYKHSLRTDLVKENITLIAKAIKETYENREKDINSILQLLGMQPAEVPQKHKLSGDTSIILNEIKRLNLKIDKIEKANDPYNIHPYPTEDLAKILTAGLPGTLDGEGDYFKKLSDFQQGLPGLEDSVNIEKNT